MEAAGEGGNAARGVFQAEHLVSQGRKRQAYLEEYAGIRDSGGRGVAVMDAKPGI